MSSARRAQPAQRVSLPTVEGDIAMFERLVEELDDPPSPEQLQLWSEVRQKGRIRYLGLGLLWGGLTVIPTSLMAEAFLYFVFGRHLGIESILVTLWALLVGAWLVFRDRWKKNETRFLMATGSRPEQEDGVAGSSGRTP